MIASEEVADLPSRTMSVMAACDICAVSAEKPTPAPPLQHVVVAEHAADLGAVGADYEALGAELVVEDLGGELYEGVVQHRKVSLVAPLLLSGRPTGDASPGDPVSTGRLLLDRLGIGGHTTDGAPVEIDVGELGLQRRGHLLDFVPVLDPTIADALFWDQSPHGSWEMGFQLVERVVAMGPEPFYEPLHYQRLVDQVAAGEGVLEVVVTEAVGDHRLVRKVLRHLQQRVVLLDLGLLLRLVRL
ncbi:MAG: hypothetical protein WAL04_01025 [Acidimicrobiales bacterium]